MHITYDAEADALYLRFETGTVTTKHVAPGVAVDFTRRGKLAGIEILDAKKRFGKDALRSVTLEEIGLSA